MFTVNKATFARLSSDARLSHGTRAKPHWLVLSKRSTKAARLKRLAVHGQWTHRRANCGERACETILTVR